MAERQPTGASDAQRLAEIYDRWVPTRGKLHVDYDPIDAVNEAEADIDWLLEYVARMRTVGQKLRDISREATSFRYGSRVTAWDAEATEDEWDALIRGEEPMTHVLDRMIEELDALAGALRRRDQNTLGGKTSTSERELYESAEESLRILRAERDGPSARGREIESRAREAAAREVAGHRAAGRGGEG